MPARPKWWHILQESRRQACTGIDFYNRAADDRSYHDFVVHMHLAWQYLLHAECERQGQDYLVRGEHGRPVKTKDGDKMTWSLAECLRWRFPTTTDPTRSNVEFFVGLRNKIEHRFQDTLMIATAGQAHAYVVNYETELLSVFGPEHSLSTLLRFPVFVQSLSPTGMKEQLAIRKKLPKAAGAYITTFEKSLDKVVREDDRYDFRILLVAVKGPKSDADMAITFMKAEDLTEERRSLMEKEGKVGTAVLVEKQRDVRNARDLAPADAVAIIAESCPFVFNMFHFTELAKQHGIRPANGASEPEKTDPRYCVYDRPWKKYVYTQAWVQKCIEETATRERFKTSLSRDPKPKVAKLSDIQDARVAVGPPAKSA